MSQVCDAQMCQDRTARDPNSKASKKMTFSTNPISVMCGRHSLLQKGGKITGYLWKVAFKTANLQNYNTVLVWFYINITRFLATASFGILEEMLFHDEVSASGYKKQTEPKSR